VTVPEVVPAKKTRRTTHWKAVAKAAEKLAGERLAEIELLTQDNAVGQKEETRLAHLVKFWRSVAIVLAAVALIGWLV
jgi:anti-sigma-K factor RskA